MRINIKPVSYGPLGAASMLEVTSTSVTLGVSASCAYQIQDAKSVPIVSGNSGLSDEQYKEWGSDDEYFMLCIAENLKLTPA